MRQVVVDRVDQACDIGTENVQLLRLPPLRHIGACHGRQPAVCSADDRANPEQLIKHGSGRHVPAMAPYEGGKSRLTIDLKGAWLPSTGPEVRVAYPASEYPGGAVVSLLGNFAWFVGRTHETLHILRGQMCGALPPPRKRRPDLIRRPAGAACSVDDASGTRNCRRVLDRAQSDVAI